MAKVELLIATNRLGNIMNSNVSMEESKATSLTSIAI